VLSNCIFNNPKNSTHLFYSCTDNGLTKIIHKKQNKMAATGSFTYSQQNWG